MNARQAVHAWRVMVSASLCMLILLCATWELWLAPLRPGGSWLALKILPLLWIAPGIVHGRLYTYRASTMLILAYFSEGVVRAWSDQGLSATLAMAEIMLTVVIFCAAIAFVRASRSIRSSTTPA